MTQSWFRRHQKQLLIVLAIIIIPTFALMFPLGRGRQGGSGEVAVVIDGEDITFARLAEYRRALLVLSRARRAQATDGEVFGILRRAKLADRAGIRVSPEQLRDAIRSVISGILGAKGFTPVQYRSALEARRVSPPVFEELVAKMIAGETLGFSLSRGDYMTEEELYIAYCREKEGVRLRLKEFRVASYEKEVKESNPPTDEDLKKYYEEHKDLSVERDLALKTEPEVGIEYGFVGSGPAGRLARTLRRTDRAVRIEQALAGSPGTLAGRLAAAALSAAHEKRLRDSYERDKRRLYTLRPERRRIQPKRAPKTPPKLRKGTPPPTGKKPKRPAPAKAPPRPPVEPKEKDRKGGGDIEKKRPGGKEGRAVPSGGAGLASMLAIPALGASAGDAGPDRPAAPGDEEAAAPVSAAPAEPEVPAAPVSAAPAEPDVPAAPADGGLPGPVPPPEFTLDTPIPPTARGPAPPAPAPTRPRVRFKPFEKVRGQVEKEVEKTLAREAAQAGARRLLELAEEWSRLRPVEPGALLSGLALGACPAASGVGGLVERVRFMRACDEAGARHGVTELRKAGDLKRVEPLGDLKGLARNALERAKGGGGDSLGWPTEVEKGSVVWRVADHLSPRGMTFEEAKETIRKRIIHERAARLARKAAEAFRDDIEEGKADVAKMRETGFLRVRDARGMPNEMLRPFAFLGEEELAPEPVAVGKGGAEVTVDVKRLAEELAVELTKDLPATGPSGRSVQETTRAAERLAEEAVLHDTDRFRVGLVAERRPPPRAVFRRDTAWRNGRSVQWLPAIRRAFMREAWGDLVGDSVKIRYTPTYRDYVDQRDGRR